MSKSDLESIIRLLKIKDYVKLDEVKGKLTEEEFALANSYRFPITILERFFNFVDVKDRWGLVYDGIEVNIISNKLSFYNAFADYFCHSLLLLFIIFKRTPIPDKLYRISNRHFI